jgi:hypothetical protein
VDDSRAVILDTESGDSTDDLTSSVATAPVSTEATKGNPNAPTLKKAGVLNGISVDITKLTSDFIDLGASSDLDGDSVTVTFEVSPFTNLITFDGGANSVDLAVEELLELT